VLEPLNSTPHSYTSTPLDRDIVQDYNTYNIQNFEDLSRGGGVEIIISPRHHFNIPLFQFPSNPPNVYPDSLITHSLKNGNFNGHQVGIINFTNHRTII